MSFVTIEVYCFLLLLVSFERVLYILKTRSFVRYLACDIFLLVCISVFRLVPFSLAGFLHLQGGMPGSHPSAFPIQRCRNPLSLVASKKVPGRGLTDLSQVSSPDQKSLTSQSMESEGGQRGD